LDRESWSIEGLIRIIDDAKMKVEEDDIDVGDAADRLKKERRFYVAASDRSGTMVENSIEVASSHPQAPIVLNVGAAHTEGVVELLKGRSASLAVIAPVALGTGDPNGSMSADEYGRKLDRKSVDPSGSLGAILDGRSQKPSSVLNEEWLQFMGNTLYAIVKLTAAAGAGGDPPFDLGNDVLNIGGAEIPPDSIHLLEGDVIFAVTLPDGQEFFVRAKQIDSETKNLDDEVSLEQALLKALENVTTETSTNVDDISTEKLPLVEPAPGTLARISKQLKELENSGPLSKETII